VVLLTGNISDRLNELITKLDETLKRYDAAALETESTPIDELLDDIQASVQEKLRDSVECLVTKLKADEYLSSEDKDDIEKWLVGDAEYYTRIENNLLDWVAECKRLFNVLKTYSSADVEEDKNKLLGLGAVLTDLKFTLSDVIRYSKALNQVDQVRSMVSVGIPNKESKQKIAELIEQKLTLDKE
jgi:hypothetical protein